MPIATFHLAEGQYDDDAVGRLLVAASRLYAQVLDSPMDRVRTFASLYRPQHCAVAGELVASGASAAPFFEFIVLAGRPVEQRHALLQGFTDLVVEHLDVPRDLIRGRAIEVAPDDWGIAGEPASLRRRTEIEARARARE